MKKVVVLLPTYNEKDNIEKFTNEVLNQEKDLSGWNVEVLIVDSDSPDGTGKIAATMTKKKSPCTFFKS